MRNLKKILNYSLLINTDAGIFTVRLKVQDMDNPIEIKFKIIVELDSFASILRNEVNTFFDIQLNTIIIEWEPIGENDPKYGQLHR